MSEDTYKLILGVLEKYDGCCMDDEEERKKIARAVEREVDGGVLIQDATPDQMKQVEEWIAKNCGKGVDGRTLIEGEACRCVGEHKCLRCVALGHINKLEEKLARYEGNAPGTPGGMLAGLFWYAEERCGRSPVASHPPLKDIEEFVQGVEQERDRANELLESCRGQLKRTQDERDSMWEILVRIHTIHGLMEDQMEAVWARNIEDLRKSFGVEP